MSISDPIADALTRIRNANSAKNEKVDLPASKLVREILRIIKREGFIRDYKFIEDKKQGILRAYLKRAPSGDSVITDIQRISKPGLRVYAPVGKIPRVLSGLGVAILSTSKGVLTGKEARKGRIGGELICKIW